jgi:outer membrane immunogenic protein
MKSLDGNSTKKLLVAGVAAAAFYGAPALAADMPVKAPPAPAAADSWTGFYVGGNVGYGWQDPTVTFAGNDPSTIDILSGSLIAGATATGPVSYNLKGVIGGIQAGYNWQVDRRWVLGLETDFNGSGIRGGGNNVSNFSSSTVQTIAANQSIEWFGTVRARLGWLATDSLMFYGTSGFAYAKVHENVTYSSSDPGLNFTSDPFGFQCGAANSTCFSGSSARTAIGWTLGAGAEYAVAQNISLKAEYLYTSLGGDAFNVVALSAFPAGGAPIPSSFRASYGNVNFQVARFGVNYKFN